MKPADPVNRIEACDLRLWPRWGRIVSAPFKRSELAYLIYEFGPLGPFQSGMTTLAERKLGDQGQNGATGLVTEVKPKVAKPSLYRVLILNDDYTPMEFV